MESHVVKCHQLIRALVEQCLAERKAKEVMVEQMRDFEQAAAAQVCVCVYIYIYIYIYMCVCIYIYVCVYIYYMYIYV